MNDFRNFIGKNDLNIIDNYFKILISMIDLNGYDIWIFYPSTKKLEKDFTFVKSVGNLVFLKREITSANGKDFTSNTIVEIGKVIIFYGKCPQISIQPTVLETNITSQQKLRFIRTFKKKDYIRTKFNH
jgi:hypothetical protein